MTEALKITTSKKRIPIERDGEAVGVLVFDPSDIIFAERFYKLLGDFQEKQTQYQARAKELDAIQGTDENGAPANLEGGIALIREICEYMRGEIDNLFGAGTSAMVFGDSMVLETFSQFFEGVTPMIQSVREEKVTRYLNQKHAGRVME